mgnify:CR=1 FL=1
MKHSLLPHQIEDAAFLASKKFCGNWSKMRTGKTLTALEAVRLLNPASQCNAVIIVGPPISLSMWKEVFEQHVGGFAQIIRSGKQQIIRDNDAVIMSYAIAAKRRDELKALGAKVLILDESHALKTISAKRTKAILGKYGLCESVDHCYMLSGTPSTRYSDDLFSFLCRADAAGMKERVGKVDMSRFRLRYCITQKKKFSAAQRFPIEVVVGNRNLTELNEWMFDGGLAVRRESVEGMPDLTTNRLIVDLDLDPELRAMLKTMEKQTVAQIQEDVANKEEHISTMRRKLGVAKVKHSVTEIVDRIKAGNGPILVGAWHIDVIDALWAAVEDKGLNTYTMQGNTPAYLRDKIVADFNAGEIDVLIGQISAMGVAIDLSGGGGHIVVIEEDWSPAIMEQFYYRMMNFGETAHPVHADIFASDTKLDKAVSRINAAKSRGHNTMMETAND